VKRTGFAPRKTPMKRSRKPSPQAIRIEPDAFRAVVKAKTRSDHLAELQDAFNAWVRLRDAGQPCISCGRPYGDRWHAGHYRSVGSEPSLRFEPDNVHLQCPPCNLHLCGNQAPYRVNLVKKIGLERIEWLDGPHEPKKYTVAEIQEMKAFYRAEIRRMKREAA